MGGDPVKLLGTIVIVVIIVGFAYGAVQQARNNLSGMAGNAADTSNQIVSDMKGNLYE